MLKNEIIKILSNKILIVVFAISMLLNGGLIYWQQIRVDAYSGITYKEYNHLNENIRLLSDTQKQAYIQEKLEELSLIRTFEAYMYAPDAFSSYFQEEEIEHIRLLYESNGYLEYTQSIGYEEKLYTEVLDEVEDVLEYPILLHNIKKNSEKILRRYDVDSYEYKRAQKSIEAYDNFSDIEMHYQPSRGIQLFMDNVTTDFLVVLCLLCAVVIAIVYEREKNLIILSKSTKNGRAKHANIKVISLLVVGIVITLFMYGETLLIAESVYDLGDLTRPIQSVKGYSLCALQVSVLQYMIIYIGIKFLFFFMCAGFFFLISSICRRAYEVYLVSGAVVAALVSMYNSISETSYLQPFKTFNPVAYGQVQQMLSRFQCVEVLGEACEKTMLYIVCMFLLVLIMYGVGICIYAHANERETVSSKGFCIIEKKHFHTGMFRHECYKTFIAYRVALIHLVGLVTACVVFVPADQIRYDDSNYHYSMYSENIKGKYSLNTDEYIEKQLTFVDDKLNEYGSNPYSSEYLTYELAKEALQDIQSYVRYLKDKPGSYYIHNGGYKMLTGGVSEMDAQNVTLAILSSVFAIVCFIVGISADFQRGEDKLIYSTLRGRKRYLLYKSLQGIISATVIYISLWLPQVLTVFDKYGLEFFEAPAYSLEHLAEIPQWISIGMYIIFKYIIRYIGILLIMMVSYVLIRRIRSSSIAIMVGVGIFVIPILLWVLGVEEMRYLTVFWL